MTLPSKRKTALDVATHAAQEALFDLSIEQDRIDSIDRKGARWIARRVLRALTAGHHFVDPTSQDFVKLEQIHYVLDRDNCTDHWRLAEIRRIARGGRDA